MTHSTDEHPTEEHGPLKLTDTRLLYMFIAFVILFGLLAYRSQHNTSAIDQHQREQVLNNWNQCQRSVQNTTKINETDQAFIDFLNGLKSPSATQTQEDRLHRFIEIYQNSKLVVPECGPHP